MRTIPLTTPNWTLQVPDDWKPEVVPIDRLNVKQWTDALRSGEYTQTDSFLHKVGDGYCCLGVLCHLQGRPSSQEMANEELKILRFDGDASGLAVTNPARPWLGGGGNIPPGVYLLNPLRQASANSLAEANDQRLPFTDIATVIETVWTNEPYAKTTT